MARASRPPIVAVMGHIDHGKSSLLDYIRKANVTAGEAGGITQHIGAYVAEHEHEGKKRSITFLDTPGHEAFRALRARGAAAADVAILVIAADEGVKPQTKEAYDAIMEANTPFVVAFTKIDKNGADVEKAKISALEAGIYLEGLGGSISFAPVSSKSGEGIPVLLDLVLLTADLAELTADPANMAAGFVLESSQDPKRGMSATLIVKDGTLSTGSFAVAGSAIAPVRFIEDFAGKRVTDAAPSQPAVVSGWNALPPSGMPFVVVKTKKEAEKLAESVATALPARRTDTSDDGKASLPIFVKADVTGSIEAIKHELAKLSHERAAVRIVHAGIGSVNENDVKTAHAGGAIIIAFTVGTDGNARDLADRLSVPVYSFSIIYDLGKQVEELLTAKAPRVQVEEVTGEVKVLKLFGASGNKQVFGGNLQTGEIKVGDLVKVMRRGIEVGKGRITNLQQARADVKEIRVAGEFGGQLEVRADLGPGDQIIAFKVVES